MTICSPLHKKRVHHLYISDEEETGTTLSECDLEVLENAPHTVYVARNSDGYTDENYNFISFSEPDHFIVEDIIERDLSADGETLIYKVRWEEYGE